MTDALHAAAPSPGPAFTTRVKRARLASHDQHVVQLIAHREVQRLDRRVQRGRRRGLGIQLTNDNGFAKRSGSSTAHPKAPPGPKRPCQTQPNAWPGNSFDPAGHGPPSPHDPASPNPTRLPPTPPDPASPNATRPHPPTWRRELGGVSQSWRGVDQVSPACGRARSGWADSVVRARPTLRCVDHRWTDSASGQIRQKPGDVDRVRPDVHWKNLRWDSARHGARSTEV